MKTSDILNNAGDHIQEHGHHKGGPFSGTPLATAPMCTVGAITYVGIQAGASPEVTEACRAAVSEYLGGGLIHWNDAPERTAAEVIEVLRAAAVIEAAKEHAETRSAVSV